jgi:hypothetical protein
MNVQKIKPTTTFQMSGRGQSRIDIMQTLAGFKAYYVHNFSCMQSAQTQLSWKTLRGEREELHAFW